jgi:hypothetical protein
VVINMCVPFFV